MRGDTAKRMNPGVTEEYQQVKKQDCRIVPRGGRGEVIGAPGTRRPFRDPADKA